MDSSSVMIKWILIIGIPVLCAILYRLILRVFFGVIIVPEDRIGLVTKKFVLVGRQSLPEGRIIATNGEAGFQAQTLAPGVYFGKWFWQYVIKFEPFTVIPTGKIGLVLARDGAELETGAILARKVPCDSFQDAEAFLRNGGRKGRQTAIITPGSYRINTFLFEVEIADMVSVPDNAVGIVTTLEGRPLEEGQIAGRIMGEHNKFQDADLFLSNGGFKGLRPRSSRVLGIWSISSARCSSLPSATISVTRRRTATSSPSSAHVRKDSRRRGSISAGCSSNTMSTAWTR
jgi:uncharacterized membrane protein YqiK